MNTWHPAETRQKFNLYMTEEEKADIREKLSEPAEDGHIYADAVFEGGGVKGTAFIGALRCFDDVGIKWRKLAGTSAGAITAAMLATELSMDALEEIVAHLDYNDFLTKKKWFIFNGSPENDLDNPLWMLLNLLLARQRGQYSPEPFLHWLEGVVGDTIPTFQPFIEAQPGAPWYKQRDLRIVVSDISRKEMLVLPTDLDESVEPKSKFSVAKAVQLSMTIPLFFEPAELRRAHASDPSKPPEKSTIVDGGILSNFPLWIYDALPNQRPKCPTFGFELVEGGTAAPDDAADRPMQAAKSAANLQSSLPSNLAPSEIKGVVGVLGGVLATMMEGHDRRYLRLNDQDRVVDIYTLNVSTTAFNLSNETKDLLYVQGYRAARKFLRSWSWTNHLKLRGFSD